MKKKSRIIFIIFIAAAVGANFLLKTKNENASKATLKLINKFNQIEKKANMVAAANDTKQNKNLALEQKVRKETILSEFKKCFKKEAKVENLESVKAVLLQQKNYSTPQLNEERFELTTNENKNIVVQHLPEEEEINKVRVFLISPVDGMPDRLKEFPQSNSEVTQKLSGALTLGKIKSKTSSTTQTAYDGSMLSIEQKDDKIVRIHLITNSFDFECKNQSCFCLKKE